MENKRGNEIKSEQEELQHREKRRKEKIKMKETVIETKIQKETKNRFRSANGPVCRVKCFLHTISVVNVDIDV